jgi:hypothetical protein
VDSFPVSLHRIPLDDADDDDDDDDDDDGDQEWRAREMKSVDETDPRWRTWIKQRSEEGRTEARQDDD